MKASELVAELLKHSPDEEVQLLVFDHDEDDFVGMPIREVLMLKGTIFIKEYYNVWGDGDEGK